MSEPKVIWSGTYAGIPADVRVVNGKPVPFLAGRVTAFVHHFEGVLGAAVMGLAAEWDTLRDKGATIELLQHALDLEVDAHRFASSERDVLRERLSKLESAARFAYDAILGSSVCDDPCSCIDCQMLETLGEALGIPRIGEP